MYRSRDWVFVVGTRSDCRCYMENESSPYRCLAKQERKDRDHKDETLSYKKMAMRLGSQIGDS